jgi:hypothetical protein
MKQNSTYYRLRNAKLLTQCALGNVALGIPLANFFGLSVRQFCVRRILASLESFGVTMSPIIVAARAAVWIFPRCVLISSSIAALRMSICYVVQIGSDEQMRWVDTRRVITSMQNTKTAWDRAIMQLPRYAMGAEILPSVLERPVVFKRGPLPRPTFVIGSLQSHRPEISRNIARTPIGATGLSAVAPPPFSEIVLGGEESNVTGFARWLGSFKRRDLLFEPFLF